MPETSAITFQRIKVEQAEESHQRVNRAVVKSEQKQQVFKLPTLSNTTTGTTTTTGGKRSLLHATKYEFIKNKNLNF